MPLLGPILLVADHDDYRLADALAGAGAFPLMDVSPVEAPAAIAVIDPCAVVIADAELTKSQADDIAAMLARTTESYAPLIARVRHAHDWSAAWTLPVAADASNAALVARLKSALRVRALHVKILRRAQGVAVDTSALSPTTGRDPLEEASVLVAGRGRSYPELSIAIGERVGLIGALSLEAVAGHLQTRDIDGIVIGEGFERALVEDLLDMLGADPRFRDLPIGVFGNVGEIDPERLPNLERLTSDYAEVVNRMLPLVRLHALGARFKRLAAALDARGVLDPETGLLTWDAFRRDLERAIGETGVRSGALAVARFAFESMDRRASADAARIVARLVRGVDFAARDDDGGIFVALAEADLIHARAVARRIASVLKHTVLTLGQEQMDPTFSLAAANSTDGADALLARLKPTGTVAAQ